MSDSWKNKIVNFQKFYIHYSWKELFDELLDSKEIHNIEKKLNELVNQKNIFPYPDNLFNAFNYTPLNKIKVVFLGQDPYHQMNDNIPQATGLSFSVPHKFKIPSSLGNIYKNLMKYGHFYKIPTHGCLEFWAYQGCLMLNNSLTVEQSSPNSHKALWEKTTERIIKYISDNTKNIVFVLWGAPALKKKKLINTNKHKIVVSSHPSGLSCYNNLGEYKAFNDQDHFGIINKYLKKSNKEEIIWQIT